MKNYYYLSVMCCALLAVSCQEEEMGFSQEEIFRGTYERSFVNQFGNIDPNQTWDFSPYGRLYANNSAVTRAVDYKGTTYPPYFEPIEGWEDEATHTPNTYYEVPSALLDWMDENILSEGDHSSLITGNFSFVWQAGQVLEILPVWQGECGQIYSLSVMMGREEKVIWSRNEGMQVKNKKNGDWVDISTTDNATYTDGKSYYRGYTGSSTVGIRVKPILITDDMLKGMGVTIPDMQELKLKLNITTGMEYRKAGSTYSCSGDYATSTGVVNCGNSKTTGTKSRIGLINIPDASISVPTGYQKWLLGCEDTMHLPSDIDWDYNDVVFLIAGKVTEPIYKEGEVERTIEKRYMVEDLTGYADFDFNDIVVDLKETYKLKYKKDEWDGVITWDTTRYNRKQVATIKHLCGTVPMQVKIGNYSLPKITNPVDQEQTKKELAGETVDAKTFWENPDQRKVGSGWSPNASFELTNLNWNVDRNNLSVSVWTNKEGDTQSANYTPWTATFPAAGKVPYIIATDVKREWLPEMTNATQEWWDALNSNTTY